MMDPELDYTLMRVCKQMIKVRNKCDPSDSNSMNPFHCILLNMAATVISPAVVCSQ